MATYHSVTIGTSILVGVALTATMIMYPQSVQAYKAQSLFGPEFVQAVKMSGQTAGLVGIGSGLASYGITTRGTTRDDLKNRRENLKRANPKKRDSR